MEKLNNPSEFSLIFKYALKDLSRNYHKISSIIVTLFISLFILSAIFTIEDSLKKELNDNAKACLLYTSPSPRDKRQSRMPSSA